MNENRINDNSFFSVVVPTYNRAGLISDTINSVLNQKFIDFELLIVDDGSTDNTEEIVSRFSDPRIKYFKKDNKERGAARNFGVLRSSSKYITFCDSDDILYPYYLSNAWETINKSNHSVPWMHVSYEIKGATGKSTIMSINPIKCIETLAKGNPLSCMGVFVKSEIIRQNLFNEDRFLSGSEDWELWLRIASQYPITVDNRVSSCLKIHDERSVLTSDELKLQLRKFLSIGYAFELPNVQKVFSNYRSRMEAYFDTYISLHLILDGKIGPSLRFLMKAIFKYPLCIFDRRILAIIKYALKFSLGLN